VLAATSSRAPTTRRSSPRSGRSPGGEVLLGRVVSGRLGAALASPSGPRPFPELTEREFAVLELLARGWSTERIAAKHFLSPKTVRNNVSAILAKLGVASRIEAVARARDAGIGVDPGIR
jgi:DNA-binding NarL/FixJ family response regulator